MKVINKIFLCCMLATVMLFGVACGGNTDNSSDSNSANVKKNYTITFRYGFDASDFDEATGTVKKYKSSVDFVSKKGKGIILTTTDKTAFKVQGYDIVGYSTTDWQKDGITKDMVVDVKYAISAGAVVNFLNPDGTLIKKVNRYHGDEDIPQNLYPALSEIVVKDNQAFSGWIVKKKDNKTFEVTAQVVETDALARKTSSVTIDGVKDSNYIKVGSMNPVVLGGTGADKGTVVSGYSVDYYVAYDGDYIYFFADVTDPEVIYLGDEFSKSVKNNYCSDTLETYVSINGFNFRLQLDPFGTQLDSGHPDSGEFAYTSWMIKNAKYAVTLKGDDKLAEYKKAGKPVKTNATGYCVEIAIPAYKQTEAAVSPDSAFGGEGWGEKLSYGSYFYFATQLNSINALPTQADIDAATKANNSGLFNKTEYGAMFLGAKLLSGAEPEEVDGAFCVRLDKEA